MAYCVVRRNDFRSTVETLALAVIVRFPCVTRVPSLLVEIIVFIKKRRRNDKAICVKRMHVIQQCLADSVTVRLILQDVCF